MSDQYPIMTAFDHAAGLVAGLVAFLVVRAAARRSPDRRAIVAAFVVKLLACYAMCAMTMPVLGGGDMIGYHHHGCRYADMLREDLSEGTTTYLETTPFFLPEKTNVHRCWSLSGLFHVLVFDSYIGSSVAFALLGFTGQVLLFRTFVTSFPDPRVRVWWKAGLLFAPSMTFWSAGLLKDPLGLFGLGCATWGAHRVLVAGRYSGVALLAFGIYTLALFRAQIVPVLLIALFPLMLASPTLRRRRRSPVVVRVLLRVGLAVAAVGVLGAISQLDKRASVLDSTKEVIEERERYNLTQGGSTKLEKGEDLKAYASSPLGMVLLWPDAVTFTLFRPFLWEGLGSPLLMAATLENLVLQILAARAAFRALSRPRVLVALVRTPLFLSCAIFVALFAFAVGLSSPNLGTVSRYRIPVLPFFIGMLAIFEARYLESQGGRGRGAGVGRDAGAGAGAGDVRGGRAEVPPPRPVGRVV